LTDIRSIILVWFQRYVFGSIRTFQTRSKHLDHCLDANEQGVRTLLLVSSAIGGIIKHNASISGAEVGCQGEVGSASAMAAAGLCASLGGTKAWLQPQRRVRRGWDPFQG
jgi:hypothetical protein